MKNGHLLHCYFLALLAGFAFIEKLYGASLLAALFTIVSCFDAIVEAINTKK